MTTNNNNKISGQYVAYKIESKGGKVTPVKHGFGTTYQASDGKGHVLNVPDRQLSASESRHVRSWARKFLGILFTLWVLSVLLAAFIYA